MEHDQILVDPPAQPSRRSSKRAVILRQAQHLFADFGYHGVSIRDIAQASEVLPTLVLYHFSSKEKLYEAVFEDVALQLTARRETRLRMLRDEGGRPPINAVLDALARPLIELRRSAEGATYARLIAREISDPLEGTRGIIERSLDPSARQVLDLMLAALPGVPARHVHWAFHYLIACLVSICANTGRISRLSRGECTTDDAEQLLAELVGFFHCALESISSGRCRIAATPAPRRAKKKRAATRRGTTTT